MLLSYSSSEGQNRYLSALISRRVNHKQGNDIIVASRLIYITEDCRVGGLIKLKSCQGYSCVEKLLVPDGTVRIKTNSPQDQTVCPC